MPRLRSSSLIVSLAPAFWCFWSADAGSKANIGFPMIAARFTSIDLRLQVSTNRGSEFLSGSLGLLWLPATDEDLPPPARKNTYTKLKYIYVNQDSYLATINIYTPWLRLRWWWWWWWCCRFGGGGACSSLSLSSIIMLSMLFNCVLWGGTGGL